MEEKAKKRERMVEGKQGAQWELKISLLPHLQGSVYTQPLPSLLKMKRQYVGE